VAPAVYAEPMLRLLLLVVVVGVGALVAWPQVQAFLEPGAGPSPPAAQSRPRTDRSGETPRVRCPQGVGNCRAVSGRIVFIESVDPDGDGDLHVVLAGKASVTAPGLSSIDVKPSLRPARDPRIGDRAAAAGTVENGSFGQGQIHALRFRVG